MPGPLGQIMGKIVEVCVEEVAKEIAPTAAQMGQKAFENVLGDVGRVVTQATMAALDAPMRQKITEFTCELAANYVGEKSGEFLDAIAPMLNEVPGEIAEWFSDTELARIGAESLESLSAEAQQKIRQAEYTSLQLGTAAVLYFNDLMGGYGEITRQLKDKLAA